MAAAGGKRRGNGLPESVKVVVCGGHFRHFHANHHLSDQMDVCAHHPERPATQYCQKHARFLCDECLRCADPKLYCRHRTSCIVWFFDRETRRKEREEERARDETV